MDVKLLTGAEFNFMSAQTNNERLTPASDRGHSGCHWAFWAMFAPVTIHSQHSNYYGTHLIQRKMAVQKLLITWPKHRVLSSNSECTRLFGIRTAYFLTRLLRRFYHSKTQKSTGLIRYLTS